MRPFFDGDVDILVDSFSVWDGNGMPCAIESGPDGTVATHGTVDLVLYYARTVANATNLQTVFDTLDASSDPWRTCIGSISLIGANLSASEDVYHPSGDGVDWNRGPNMQVCN